ncbi:MAG: hypothetical protein SAL70_24290, partial [Scytonema sp. PMC 1070.18]|nr:hypothetical protein [Scytonema sp. PMC 1070.18]
MSANCTQEVRIYFWKDGRGRPDHKTGEFISGRTGEDARTTRRESLFLEGRARTPGPQDARVY